MKKIITLAVGVVAMLTSCSKEEISSSVNPNTDQVTITLAAEDAVATRSASQAPTRYIVEAYSDDTYSTAANIFSDETTNQTTITPSSGVATLNLTIDRTKDYYFLFWSDASGDDVYTTTSLTAVTLNSGKTPVESWQGSAQILSGTSQSTLGVTLTRAVARLCLMENGKIPAGSSLVMTFDHNTVFNVSSGTVSTTASRTQIIAIENAVNGSTESPVQLNSSEIYLFAIASDDSKTTTVHNITFWMYGEDSFVVTNVPFQANHATNITGHYTSLASETFTLSVDDTWNSTENDVDVDATDTWDDSFEIDITSILGDMMFIMANCSMTINDENQVYYYGAVKSSELSSYSTSDKKVAYIISKTTNFNSSTGTSTELRVTEDIYSSYGFSAYVTYTFFVYVVDESNNCLYYNSEEVTIPLDEL